MDPIIAEFESARAEEERALIDYISESKENALNAIETENMRPLSSIRDIYHDCGLPGRTLDPDEKREVLAYIENELRYDYYRMRLIADTSRSVWNIKARVYKSIRLDGAILKIVLDE